MYSLSNKSEEFVNQHKLSKPVETIYDSTIESYGKLESNNPCKYEIWINPDKVFENNFDYFYIHEYLHAVQLDEKFPCLVCGSEMSELQFIASMITSLVADINVIDTLNALGLHINETIYEERIAEFREILQKDKALNINSDIAQHVFLLSTQLALIYYDYNKEMILNLLIEYNILANVIGSTKTLIQIINKCGYKTNLQCLAIFKTIYSDLLVPFGLGQYYSINE